MRVLIACVVLAGCAEEAGTTPAPHHAPTIEELRVECRGVQPGGWSLYSLVSVINGSWPCFVNDLEQCEPLCAQRCGPEETDVPCAPGAVCVPTPYFPCTAKELACGAAPADCAYAAGCWDLDASPDSAHACIPTPP